MLEHNKDMNVVKTLLEQTNLDGKELEVEDSELVHSSLAVDWRPHGLQRDARSLEELKAKHDKLEAELEKLDVMP